MKCESCSISNGFRRQIVIIKSYTVEYNEYTVMVFSFLKLYGCGHCHLLLKKTDVWSNERDGK